MPKHVEEAIIRQIQAEKAAVTAAAEAYVKAKRAKDAIRGTAADDQWANSPEGKDFIAGIGIDTAPKATGLGRIQNFFLGDKGKPVYARATRSEFTGIPDRLLNEENRAISVAQQDLLAAQEKLHDTMFQQFGTRANRMANDDASLVNAVKSIGNIGSWALDMFTKPGSKAAGDVLSIFIGSKSNEKDRFLADREGFKGIAKGVLKLGLSLVSFDAKGLGEGLGTIVRNLAGIVKDVLTIPVRLLEVAARAVALPFVAAGNLIKATALVGYKALRGVSLALGEVFAPLLYGASSFLNMITFGLIPVVGGAGVLAAPKADFSLKDHVNAEDLANATNEAANTETHKEIDASIESNTAAKEARDAAITSAENKQPKPDALAIQLAGREAGRSSLKEQVGEQMIQDQPAAIKAYNKVMDNPTGWRGQELYKDELAQRTAALAAGRKAGLKQLGGKVPDLSDAKLVEGQAKNAALDNAVLSNDKARDAANEAYGDVLNENPGAIAEATLAARQVGLSSLRSQDATIANNTEAQAAADIARQAFMTRTPDPLDKDQTKQKAEADIAARKAGVAMLESEKDVLERKIANLTDNEDLRSTATDFDDEVDWENLDDVNIGDETTHESSHGSQPVVMPRMQELPRQNTTANQKPEIIWIDDAIKHNLQAQAAYKKAFDEVDPFASNVAFAQEKAGEKAAVDSILTQLNAPENKAARDVAIQAFKDAGGVGETTAENRETQLQAREQAAIAGMNAMMNPPEVVIQAAPLSTQQPKPTPVQIQVPTDRSMPDSPNSEDGHGAVMRALDEYSDESTQATQSTMGNDTDNDVDSENSSTISPP
jgi:hypothetical protein